MSPHGAALNSRDDFLQRVDALIRTGSAHERALLVINVRHLRDMNIALGSARTDRLLLQLRERFSAQVRADDVAAHLGGDEYGIFLSRLPSPAVASLAAAKLHGCVKPVVAIDGDEVPVRLNIGIASVLMGDTAETALRKANTAVADARRSERETVTYSESIRSTEQDSLALRKELRGALENGDLQLYYQPKIDLATGAVHSAEALMRWRSSTRGWVPPEVFVAIAEQPELIEPFSFWAINTALRQRSLCRSKPNGTSVAVNLSANILHHPHLVEIVTRAMNIWGTQPGNLILEVTESAMMHDPAASLRTLQMLHDQGITISVDDFGTGYSSLAYLKKLPIRELKIDKSFVLNMHNDRDDESIVRAIIDLSHTLGVAVVAEGIENADTLDRLTRMGCDYGQGFFIAKPMPADGMREWVASRDAAIAQAKNR